MQMLTNEQEIIITITKKRSKKIENCINTYSVICRK